jgi:hypothetical protein
MGEVVAAIVAAVVYIAGAVGGTTALIQLVVTVAATAYSYKKASDQKAAARKAAKRAAMETQQRNSFRNFRQPLAARRIVYGRCRVAGPFIFAHNPDDGTMAHLIVALAGHEIDAIEAYFILNDQITVFTVPGASYGLVSGKYTNNVIIWPFLGTDAQDIGAKMRTATDVRPGRGAADIGLDDLITEDDRFAGIAALYIVTHQFGADLEGAQPDFAARIRGKKLYDPRTDTTAWSENPALAAADYLTSIMKFPWDAIDLQALEDAADACDEILTTADSTTQKRYIISGIIDADTEHREALDLIADAMAGAIRYSSGKWIIEAGVPKETSPIAFHESHVLAPYDLEIERPARALPNAVRGNFFDEETSQPMSFPQFILPGADPGKLNWLDIELPLVKNHIQAQRIARIQLGLARARRSLSLEFDLRGMLVRPGDVVPFTAPDLGIHAEPFLIDGWTLSHQDKGKGAVLTTRLDLIDYDPSIYDWDAETDEQELQRGTVNLIPIPGQNPVNGLVCDELNAGVVNNVWLGDYVFSWDDDLHDPDAGTPASLRATIILTLGWRTSKNGGWFDVSSSRTIPYTGGPGTNSVPLSADFGTGGVSFSSRIIKRAFVQIIYTNGTFSPPRDASFIA